MIQLQDKLRPVKDGMFEVLVERERIVRSATYLLFVLFGTAGIYFLLGYTFLGSVQIMVYAGGIVVL